MCPERNTKILKNYFNTHSHDQVTRNNNYLLQIPKNKVEILVEQLKAPKGRKSAFFQERLLFGFFDVLNFPLSKKAWYPIFKVH